MGGFGEDSNKGIDASVGGLVWVRRRNGSWWPGRIVGPDELPEGCVSTPKAGTPVKLLGREDASVDWYNLERSKRVKPFRCGEYDDCIEKAKASASASHPSKKSVKYARREEAILEALELESARLGKDAQDEEHHHVAETPSLKSSERGEGNNEDLSSSEDESDSAPEVSQSGVSFEEANHVDATLEKSKRRRPPNDSEDDGIEGGAKRMRGLEDLGIGVMASPKRKRSKVAVNDFSKRKSRRRTLTKVLECTAMVPVPDVPEKLSSPTESSVPGASDSKVSGIDSNELKLNNSLVINNNSDSTGVSCENLISLNTSRHSSNHSHRTEPKENDLSSTPESPVRGFSRRLSSMPLLDEEKSSAGLSTSVSGARQKTQVGAGAQSSQSSRVETASLGNEEHNESGSTSSGTADLHNVGPGMDKGASKWQSKGKRNSRSRKMDMDEETEPYMPETDWDGHLHLKSRAVTEDILGWNWNASQRQSHGSTADIAAPKRQLPCRQSRFTVNPKYDDYDFSLRHHTAGSGLYDVPVEVSATHRSQHVPFISLMSKISGRPIIGHPLTVETLGDGSCNELLGLSECHSSNSELDYNLSNVSATRPADSFHKQKPRGRPPRKHRTSKASKFSKSRRNTPSSKKVRRLSSLTNLQIPDEAKPLVEKISGPSVACVPLKVVFSRINAALNG